MTRQNILLVHGACHASWCWDRVAPLLRSAGHAVAAPDLPGRAARGAPGWRWTLEAYADAVVQEARKSDGPVVAVGHSMGGMVIAAAAERAPELFSRLVHVSSFLPISGDSLASIGALDKHSDLAGATKVAWLGGRVMIRPERLGPVYYSDCTPSDVAWAQARIVPESLKPSIERVRLTPRSLAVPRSYIRCSEDRALSVQAQDLLLERQPCERVATLKASHSPFISMPDQFVAALQSVI